MRTGSLVGRAGVPPLPRRPPLAAASGRADLLAVVALTALAAGLRFAGLGHQGFWFDEGNTALLVHLSPGEMLALIPKSESTPPLYYCLAWVWAQVFGDGEAGLRSLSALAGVLTVPAVFLAARATLSRRGARFVAALATCNPFLIWYSQEARSYALLVLFTTVALAAWFRVRTEPSPRPAAIWALASVLALATHYYAVLAIVPQAVCLLAEHRRRRPVGLSIGAIVLCGLALLPIAVAQVDAGNTKWIARIPLGARLSQIAPGFLLGPGSPHPSALVDLAVTIAALALAVLVARARGAERRGGLTCAGLALAGLVLNLGLVAVGTDDLIARNLLALWPPAALAVAAGCATPLAGRRIAWLGVAAVSALCAGGVAAAIEVQTDWTLQRPDWRLVARALGPGPGPGAPQRVILLQRYRDRLPLSLYEPRVAFWRQGKFRVTNELDIVTARPGLDRAACWWGAACNLVPATVPVGFTLPGFRELSVRQVRQFTVTRFAARRPLTVTRAEIAAALHTSELGQDGLLTQG